MTEAPEFETEVVFRPHTPPGVQVAGIQALFPVHRVYCVGRNYREHAREMGESLRDPPFFFSKPADAVCTDAVIPYPPMTENLHHEVELVVALGNGGAHIRQDQASSLIYGYAVGVDLTRRDLQAGAKKLGRPWTIAKGFDRSAPLSAIKPVSACGLLETAAISLSVNGDLRQQGNISDMTWSVPEIISELSRYFELKAGDLVFTGTPPGVGALLPGDRVECSIEAVGSLCFQVKYTG
jgi:fumarylpyruvate hydrolase